MTSLTQLIQESIPQIKPGKNYTVDPGCVQAMLMLACVTIHQMPDFDEFADMIRHWNPKGRDAPLSFAEKMAVVKRASEISELSEYTIAYKQEGSVLTLVCKDKTSGEKKFTHVEDERGDVMMVTFHDKYFDLTGVFGRVA